MIQGVRAANQVGTGAACFVVGQDRDGHWLALDRRHRAGGLFKSRQDALRYARFETGHRPDGVVLATGPLCLDF